MPATGYDFDNLVKAWTKSAFGLLVAFAMFYVFNSVFLAFLAAAFFFFIPMTNRGAENLINRSLFGTLMFVLLFWAYGVFGTGLGLDLGISVSWVSWGSAGIALFLLCTGLAAAAAIWKKSYFGIAAITAFGFSIYFLEPWNWAASAIIFTGIWLMGFVSGVAGTNESRSTVGIIVLVVAFVLYSMGPGSQDVGVAFFGDWWPTIHNSVSTFTTPLASTWTQLSKTFGDAFLLMTNPVGYATQLMNGSYSSNGDGLTGAYGVDMQKFDVTQIFIEQPFQITTIAKNNGAYNAERLSMTITSGADSPLPASGLSSLSSQRATIATLGIDVGVCKNQDTQYKCTIYYDDKLDNSFIKNNMWQAAFTSNKISCSDSAKFQIRKKYLPINVILRYDYQSDSTLGTGTDKLEFISTAEWERLAGLGSLQTKDVKSEYTSGPVIFPIGTAGIVSPIKETQDFHLSLKIQSAQKGGNLEKVDSIELKYPTDFILFDGNACTPTPTSTDASNGIIKWNPQGKGDQYFFCHFKPLNQNGKGGLQGSPTKTYVVTAHAKYTYAVSKDYNMKVQFGSWCCTQESTKDACASGMTCCAEDKASGKGICIPDGQKCESGGTTTSFSVDDASYCADRINKNNGNYGKCLLGWGGCKNNGDCCTQQDNSGLCANAAGYTIVSVQYGDPVCSPDGVCCYNSAPAAKCRAAYQAWKGLMPARSDTSYYAALPTGSAIQDAFNSA